MSFVTKFPHLVKHYDNIKNDTLISDVSYGSKKTFYFTCAHGHSFTATPHNINKSKHKRINCPQCVKNLFKEKPFLLHWFDKTKNTVKADEVTAGSKKDIILTCKNGHSFTRKPKTLFDLQKELTCTTCSGVECTHETSLTNNNPELLEEWYHAKNEINPNEIAYNSNKKVWWKCENNHEWEQEVSYRTGTRYRNKEPSKCPYCYQYSKSRNELIIFSEIKQFFNNTTSGHIVDGKEIDIFIHDLNLGIEYDGEHWHKNKTKSDKEKNSIFKSNGIDIIRVREEGLKKISNVDILFNTNENLFNVISYILMHVKNNYGINKSLKQKISNYISNNKTTNDKELHNIIDNFKIQKITDSTIIEEYSSKNSLPLHYYGKGSDYVATWNCSSCSSEYQSKIRNRTRRKTNCCSHCR